MASIPLPLSLVCNVSVTISPLSVAAPQFNQGLIVGPSTVIPSMGGSGVQRIRQYTSLLGMTADGFATNSPEYIAAGLYFGQTPAPQYLWIGRQDLTAISAVVVGSSGGTGYQVGDVLSVTQSGAASGQVQVSTISTGGVVTGLTPVSGSQGTGYSVASGLASTGGHGTGCLVNITAIGETPLQALTACRLACSVWWACMITDAVTADHEAIAAWIQGVTPPGCYFCTTSDAAVLNGTSGNLLSVLSAANYTRAFTVYSSTTLYACAAAMGRVMGLNTGLAGSYFTVKFKQLAGVAAEALTQAQVNTIENNHGNFTANYANAYTWIEQGTVANGLFLDEILNLDMLGAAIQYNVVNLLTGVPAVPLTNNGQQQLLAAVDQACQTSANIGFIAANGGIWQGQQILNLTAGDPLPKGWLSQSPPVSTLTSGQRAARQAPPIYVALLESGSAHSLTVGVYVQR